MKKNLWIILFLFPFSQIPAQLVLKIDSLIISDIIEIREKNVITSHFGSGPTIAGFLVLENNTDTDFLLDKNNLDISLEFVGKNGSKFDRLLWTSRIEDNKGKYIEAHKRLSVFDIVSLMLFDEETEFANFYIIDHFSELECILPSLNIVLTINDDIKSRIPVNSMSQLFVDDIINKIMWHN